MKKYCLLNQHKNKNLKKKQGKPINLQSKTQFEKTNTKEFLQSEKTMKLDIQETFFIGALCQGPLITTSVSSKTSTFSYPSRNQHQKMDKISSLIVDSRVEILTLLFRVTENEYDLYMKMDTNTNGHRQWFYFSVKNFTRTTVKFNIFRFKKRYSLFQRGMKPYVRSRKGKNYWHPGGQKVLYKKEKQSNEYGVHKDKHTYYLTFEYKFEFEEDEVFFAAGIPYTYSFLNTQIDRFINMQQCKSIKFTKSNICKSMCGLNIPLITIQSIQNKQNQDKNFIIINTRTHAGETSCSWVLDGLLSQISKSQRIENWITENNIVFKIIPMLNPDGVFMGNYRTGIIGDDFNRKFLSGKKQFFPEIYALKKIISECKKIGKIQLFLDLHGHSILKNSFIYGPVQQLFCQFPLKSLPFSLWHSSKYFRFSSCKFKFEKQLNETARVYFQIKESILTFTCENSLGLYYDHNHTFQMLEKDYRSFGVSIVENISQLLTKTKIEEALQDRKAKEKEKMRVQVEGQQKKINNLQTEQKKFIKIKNTFSETTKNGFSPKKKFPSIQHKFNQKQIISPIEQPHEKNQLDKQKQVRITIMNEKSERKQAKKKNIKMEKINNLLTAKSDKNEKKQESEVEKRLQEMLNQDILRKQFMQTGGIFPKKIQEFESKKREQKDLKFKIRRKSDALKFMPENLKKKIGEKPIKKFSSSKYISENEQNCSFQRSVTYDSAYLSTHMDKLQTQNKNEELEVGDEQSQNSLSIIDEKFSEGYESMNDEDSESQDLCEKEKNFILEYIRNNRKLKTTQNQDSEEESEIDEQMKDNPQNLTTNINGFKEIRFKSIEQKMEKGIPSLKQAKREPHKFREFTHKSLGRDYREQDGLIQIIQRKKLNERVQPKKNRDPYFLIQIKNKNL